MGDAEPGSPGATRFAADAFVPIAVADRSGTDESLFYGAGVVLAADGEIAASSGDPHLAVYPRSALKPIQAFAMTRLGLDLPDHLLAVVCASHDGTPMHVAAVEEILARSGLAPADLENTPALPLGDEPHAAAVLAGTGPSSITQNCSGKHAGMLATCVAQGWPTSGYCDPDHPLQRAITATMLSLGCRVEHVGVDGCGAPTHVLHLDELARAIGRLAATRIGTAMSAAPEMVGGHERDVTRWMAAVPGLLAKDGAEGVMVLGLPDGRAAAFKIAGGDSRARQTVTAEALRLLGVEVDAALVATRELVRIDVLGHGRPVGSVRPLPWVRHDADGPQD